MKERTTEQRLSYDIMRRCVTYVKLSVYSFNPPSNPLM